MNICMVSDDFLPAATGVGIHVQRVTKALIARGHRVSIITTRRKGEPKFELWNSAEIHRTFTMKIYGFYQSLPRRAFVRRILSSHHFDIIHYHYLGFLLTQVYKAAKSLHVKQVYTYHMTVDHLTQPILMKPFRPVIARLHTRYCNSFDLILAPSKRLIPEIKGYRIETPIRFLSNPIASDLPRQNPPSSMPENFTVLYVGRLNPEKNLPLLLKAFAKLLRHAPNSELWIAGEGGCKSRLLNLARKLEIEDRVQFFGFVEEKKLSRLYALAHVFVLPSLLETQGLVVMEAMSFGKPVIVTTHIVSAQELVDDGVNGFVVRPDSEDELTNRLISLSEDSELRSRMGQASLARAQDYDITNIVPRLEEHYLSLLQC